MLDGIVELDETYIWAAWNRGKGRIARVDNKEVVVGIRKRNGDLRFFHAKDAKSGTLAKFIKDNISEDVEDGGCDRRFLVASSSHEKGTDEG